MTKRQAPYPAPPQFVRSRVMRSVVTWRQEDIRPLRWADRNPDAWSIVTSRRSQAFGAASAEYPIWTCRATDPCAVLLRLRTFHELVVDGERRFGSGAIHVWAAKFTLEHFNDEGFTGGMFRQHDGRGERCMLVLDYTPETLNEVLDRFCRWMDPGWRTRRVTLDGATVREFKSPRKSR